MKLLEKGFTLLGRLIIGMALVLSLILSAEAKTGLTDHEIVAALTGDPDHYDGPKGEFLIHDYLQKSKFRYFPFRGKAYVDNRLDQEGREVISDFSGGSIDDVTRYSEKVIYLFGGPDSVYPALIFPNLKELFLVGLEPVGRLPDISSPEKLNQYAKELGVAFSSLPFRSYFVTRTMEKQLKEHGALTVAAVGLVAFGNKIVDITYLDVNKKGEVTVNPASQQGVRIDYEKPDGSMASVYYFQQNLAGGEYLGLPGVKAAPGVLNFFKSRELDTAFYKAASYMSFSTVWFEDVNTFVLDNVRYVVQTDSGLPFKLMDEKTWDVELYGQYTRPNLTAGLYERGHQPELQALFDQGICDSRDDIAKEQLEKLRSNPNICLEIERPSHSGYTWRGRLPFRYGYQSHVVKREIPNGDEPPVISDSCGDYTIDECKGASSHLIIGKKR